jgi:hypothetical protein
VRAKRIFSAKDLEALGAERLAELLIEIANVNATAIRRLRLELAARRSTDAPAKAVGAID